MIKYWENKCNDITTLYDVVCECGHVSSWSGALLTYKILCEWRCICDLLLFSDELIFMIELLEQPTAPIITTDFLEFYCKNLEY